MYLIHVFLLVFISCYVTQDQFTYWLHTLALRVFCQKYKSTMVWFKVKFVGVYRCCDSLRSQRGGR